MYYILIQLYYKLIRFYLGKTGIALKRYYLLQSHILYHGKKMHYLRVQRP